MQMVPVKDLRDMGKVSRLSHEAHVTKNGHPDMAILSSDADDKLAKQAESGRIAAMVQEGIDEFARGESVDAFEVVVRVRAKHGL